MYGTVCDCSDLFILVRECVCLCVCVCVCVCVFVPETKVKPVSECAQNFCCEKCASVIFVRALRKLVEKFKKYFCLCLFETSKFLAKYTQRYSWGRMADLYDRGRRGKRGRRRVSSAKTYIIAHKGFSKNVIL